MYVLIPSVGNRYFFTRIIINNNIAMPLIVILLIRSTVDNIHGILLTDDIYFFLRDLRSDIHTYNLHIDENMLTLTKRAIF